MKMIDLVVACLAIALVIFTVSRLFKSSNGSSDSGGCSGCCGSCLRAADKKTKE